MQATARSNEVNSLKVGMTADGGDGCPPADGTPAGAVAVSGPPGTGTGLAGAPIIPDFAVKTSGCPHDPATGPHPLAALPAGLVSPAAALALVDLDQLARWMAAAGAAAETLLAPAERAQFARYRNPKRRLEWLGGRLAGKHALHQLAASGLIAALLPQQYPILADAHGRPGVDWSGRAGTPPALSISHCRGYAAALARVGGACGLDIEPVAPRLATVQARFTTPEEIALLHALPDPLTRLALIWTAKEAVKKCFLHDEPTFVSRISLIAATIDPADPVLTLRCRVTGPHDPTPTVRVTTVDHWILACTEEGEHA